MVRIQFWNSYIYQVMDLASKREIAMIVIIVSYMVVSGLVQ